MFLPSCLTRRIIRHASACILDVFSFFPSAGEIADITVSRRGGATPCVELFTGTGQRIGSSCTTAGAQIRLPLTTSGLHTIRISEQFNDGTVSYTLSLERIAPPSSRARGLSFTQTYADEINPVGDTDLFYVEAQASETIEILVSRRGGATPCVELLDPSGQRINSVCSTAGALIRSQLAASGRHAVRISEQFNDGTVQYTVSLQCLGACGSVLRPVSFFPLIADGILPGGTYFNTLLRRF